MDVVMLVLTLHTLALVLASLLLLYPMLAYAWNVAYTTELLLLDAAFIFLAGGYVAGVLLDAAAVSDGLDLAASLAVFWAMWRLATRFVRTEDAGGPAFESLDHESEGGFREGE